MAKAYKAELREGVGDNWEILECIAEIDENPIKAVKLAKMLLTDDSYNKLKDFCTVDGRVSAEKMSEKIVDILSNSELKNS